MTKGSNQNKLIVGDVEPSAGVRYVPELKESMEVTFNYTKHSDTRPSRRKEIDNFYSTLSKMCKQLRVKKVLDAGCGEGFTLDQLRKEKIGNEFVGIDNSAVAINLGKKLFPSFLLKVDDIYNLSFNDSSQDLVICTEVLEHLKEPDRAIKELIRVSKKYIVLSVPNEPFFSFRNLLKGKHIKRLGNTPGHINWWTSFVFEKLIKKLGLRILKVEHPFPFTLILAMKV